MGKGILRGLIVIGLILLFPIIIHFGMTYGDLEEFSFYGIVLLGFIWSIIVFMVIMLFYNKTKWMDKILELW